MSYEVYKVENDEMLRLRYRRRVPWDKIISLLLEGHEVFIPCDRRTAYYVKKGIEKRIGEPVETYPSVYKDMEGYLFKISLVRKVLSERFRSN